MGWAATAWSLVSGAASGAAGWAGAVKAVFGFGDDVTKEVHDANQRTAGRNEVKADDSAASAKVNSDVAKAAVDTDGAAVADSLRKGQF